MKIVLVSILLFLGIEPSIKKHDIHVSKCEIQYNEESKSFEVAAHIYADDLQTILGKYGAPHLALNSDREPKETNDLILKYLTNKFKITMDGKSLSFTFIGKEASEDFLAVWCYLEFPANPDFKELKIQYEVLMDLYDDQRNIINIKAKGKKGYSLLHNKHREETIKF